MKRILKETNDNNVARALELFEIGWKINPASLASRYLTGSLFKEWLYIVIPITLFAVDIFVMLESGVFYVAGERFCYVRDISNSIVLTVLFFLSYFLSGYYPQIFAECKKEAFSTDYLKKVYDEKEKQACSGWIAFAIVILGAVSFFSGYSFYSTAGANENAFWIRELSQGGRVYYMFFLALTWYQSLSVLMMLFASNFTIYSFLKKDKIIYWEEDYNENKSIRKMFDILINNFSYGIFYIGGTVIFILTDKINGNSVDEINNAFTNNFLSLGIIILVLFLVAIAYIPLRQLIKYMYNKKWTLINKLKLDYEKANVLEEKEMILKRRNQIANQSIYNTSISNKLVIFSSVIVPVIGIILQILQLVLEN